MVELASTATIKAFMAQNDNNAEMTQKSRIVEINLDELRPDPVKTATAHRNSALVFAAIASVALGYAGYAGLILGAKKQGGEIHPGWGAAAGAIIGAILGYWSGSRHKTYEEQVYNLINTAAKEPNTSKGLQEILVKDMKKREAAAAAAAAGR